MPFSRFALRFVGRAVYVLPVLSLVIVALGQSAPARMFSQTVSQTVSQAVPQAVPDPIASPAPTGSMPDRAEQFITLAAEGNFVEAWQYLHPSVRQTWSPVDMQSSWRDLQDRTGAFQRFLGYQQAEDNVVLINTQFENVTDNLIVIFDDTQQWIVGVDFPQE